MLKDKVIKAYNYAEKAHEGQTRNFSGLPYFSHPKGVARILRDLGIEDVVVISAALLHDTIEDTTVTYEDISNEFGVEIADLVEELTSDPIQTKQMGKKHYLLQKMLNMSLNALLIKLADRLHNILYLQGDDVKLSFIEKYYKETVYIIRGVKEEKTLSFLHNTLIAKIEAVLEFLKIRHKF